MTSPGSSARVEIWSVSTIAQSPYADALRAGDPVERDDVVVYGGSGRPPCSAASRAAAAGSASANERPRLSGARCGISTARALSGFAAMIAVISASSANSS